MDNFLNACPVLEGSCEPVFHPDSIFEFFWVLSVWELANGHLCVFSRELSNFAFALNSLNFDFTLPHQELEVKEQRLFFSKASFLEFLQFF